MIRIWFNTLLSYLQAPLQTHADRERQEIREEIAFHLSASAEAHQQGGKDPRQSQMLALEEFGDTNHIEQECCNVSLSQHFFWHRLHQFLTLILIAAVGYFCWFLISDRGTQPVESATLAPSGYTIAETNGSLTGKVVDAAGKPIPGAHVLAVVKTWPGEAFRQNSFAALTDEEGTFQIDSVYPPGEKYAIQIAAIAEDHLFQSQYISLRQGSLEPFRFELQQSTPLRLRFETEAGAPLKGVSAFPFERTENNGQEHCIYFCSAKPIIRKSDGEGIVALSHFRPEEQASVYVRFPGQEWEPRQLVIPRSSKLLIITPTDSNQAEGG